MSKAKSSLHVVTNSEKEKVSSSVSPDLPNEKKPDAAHQRSHAAHLDTAAVEHTKPAGNLRQGSYPAGRKQP